MSLWMMARRCPALAARLLRARGRAPPSALAGGGGDGKFVGKV